MKRISMTLSEFIKDQRFGVKYLSSKTGISEKRINEIQYDKSKPTAVEAWKFKRRYPIYPVKEFEQIDTDEVRKYDLSGEVVI